MVNYLVLVNKNNPIPDNWNVNLVSIKNVFDEDIEVEEEAYKHYLMLKKDLKNNNINIEIDSSYRSIEKQQEMLEKYTEKYAAIPGYSEHHTGLAIDICLVVDGKLIIENEDMLNREDVFIKIYKYLPKYGFILRYPKGKENIIGYNYEPWHIRYVGNIAQHIMDNDLTLEEYLKGE